MDKTTKLYNEIFFSEKFRTPLNSEKEIGLWVDRIGIGINSASSKPKQLRILGLYAAVCVDSGKGFFYSDKTGEIAVGPGDTMIVFPDVPHTYYPDKKWETHFVVWGGPESEKLEKLGFLRKDVPVIKGSSEIVTQANRTLLELMNHEELASILERKNIALNMILDLFKASNQSHESGRTHLELQKAINFMKSNFTEDISIQECAREAGLSETHFRRLFKSHTGRSPKDFLTSLRISKAKELISSGKSIKESAFLVGYEDVFYFMRVFKNTTGISPGKFSRK
jgi:AraC-like DNA-binding protein